MKTIVTTLTLLGLIHSSNSNAYTRNWKCDVASKSGPIGKILISINDSQVYHFSRERRCGLKSESVIQLNRISLIKNEDQSTLNFKVPQLKVNHGCSDIVRDFDGLYNGYGTSVHWENKTQYTIEYNVFWKGGYLQELTPLELNVYNGETHQLSLYKLQGCKNWINRPHGDH